METTPNPLIDILKANPDIKERLLKENISDVILYSPELRGPNSRSFDPGSVPDGAYDPVLPKESRVDKEIMDNILTTRLNRKLSPANQIALDAYKEEMIKQTFSNPEVLELKATAQSLRDEASEISRQLHKEAEKLDELAESIIRENTDHLLPTISLPVRMDNAEGVTEYNDKVAAEQEKLKILADATSNGCPTECSKPS